MGEMKKKTHAREARARGRRARFFFHFAHLFPSACYAGYASSKAVSVPWRDRNPDKQPSNDLLSFR